MRPILFVLAMVATQAASADSIRLVIHGGAGAMTRAELTPAKEASIRADLERALRAGHAVLVAGGSSLDAVTKAVVVMEEGTKEVEVGARLADQAGKALEAISSVVRQSAELVQEISLASKQQVRGTEGVANAMQIISNITRQTSQGARQTARTVENMVKLSEQLNEALSQFRISSGGPVEIKEMSAAAALSRR